MGLARLLLCLVSLIMQLSASPIYAGSARSMMGISCNVVRGSPGISVKAGSHATANKYCSVRKENRLVEYNISCPEGTSVCVRQKVKKYKTVSDGSTTQLEELDTSQEKTYSDPNCGESWEQGAPQYHTYNRETGPSFKGGLYCKKNTDERKDSKSKVITEVILEITY